MVWSLETSNGHESAKIRWELVPYTNGRVLEVGVGTEKAFPHFIGLDNGDHADKFGWGRSQIDIRCDALDLSLFASQSCDAVFSSHVLEHIDDYRAALREWWRVIKVGGHLCLYLPHKYFYPNIGEPGANPTHVHDFLPQDIIDAMFEMSNGWDCVRCDERNEGDEYSMFVVFKKLGTKDQVFSYREPKPEKTCGIVRYGGFGDAIQASSILPWLKEQGYHITFFCADMTYAVLQHEPLIDRFIVQGRDQVPNGALGAFWEHESKKYDRWINLSESVEGTLLAIPGRANHGMSKEARHRLMNINYLEMTHAIADVPLPPRQRFMPTTEEKAWARNFIDRMNAEAVILWSLAGSSVHKTWPFVDNVLAQLMLDTRDLKVILVGDEACKILEQGWENEPRVVCKSGEFSIRQSLTLCSFVDLIIGGETGLLNAAGMLDVPKIITLSHSTPENLTKHWRNTIALEPSTPCYPCHRLHYGWDHCVKQPDYSVAQCQYDIQPETLYEAIAAALKWVRAA